MPAIKKVSREDIIDAAVEVLREGGIFRCECEKRGAEARLFHPAYLFFFSKYV